MYEANYKHSCRKNMVINSAQDPFDVDEDPDSESVLNNLFFLTAISLVLRAEDFSLAFLVDILPLGSGSVDPHYF